MANYLWKYATAEQCGAFLHSLKLFGETELSVQEQVACLYSLSNTLDQQYTLYKIPKSSGGVRTLAAPSELLKRVQTNILKNVLSQFSCSQYASAYRKGISLRDNSQPHVGKQLVLKLDIEDFFDSMSVSLVYQRAFPRNCFPKAVAGLLTQLCCFNHGLPQGAPTSPWISNLVMKPFDEYMGQWCKARGISYTRFCDDLTFSGDFDPLPVKRKARSFLAELGFTLNKRKTKQQPKERQQIVTGVVVNEKPQAPRAYRKLLRQEIYYCLKFGTHAHLRYKNKEQGTPLDKLAVEKYLLSLLSKTSFVLQLNPGDREFVQAREQLKRLLAEHRAADRG